MPSPLDREYFPLKLCYDSIIASQLYSIPTNFTTPNLESESTADDSSASPSTLPSDFPSAHILSTPPTPLPTRSFGALRRYAMSGCYRLTEDECCDYIDGRSDWLNQQCIIVGNVIAPKRDMHVACQPVGYVTGDYDFQGDIADSCSSSEDKEITFMDRVRSTSRAALLAQKPSRIIHEQLTDLFESAEQLRASVWKDYFERIYGIETMRFPFSLQGLTFFYYKLLPRQIIQSLHLPKQKLHPPWYFLPSNGSEQIQFGELFGHYHGTHNVKLWRMKQRNLVRHMNVWRCIYPYCTGGRRYVPEEFRSLAISQGHPSHSKVEVLHACCDGAVWPSDSAWFYWTVGSGVYLDLRNTLVLRSHDDIWMDADVLQTLGGNKNFCCISEDHKIRDECERRIGGRTRCRAKIIRALKNAGFHTVQFTNWDQEHFADYEIWDLNNGRTEKQQNNCLHGTTPGILTHGWNGTLGECDCTTEGDFREFLNCDAGKN